MTHPLIDDDGEPTPLGAAVLELIHLHDWCERRAVLFLLDRFTGDMHCPVSALYDAAAVRRYYRSAGLEVIAVPLPVRALAG